ncbi:MAG TPA: phosphatase PAP2 family protein [Pseudonocardiaceae bacterium]|nr:phosphatase PAP2 family protein [Pseudonocardiaceae bacterium]
MSAVEHEPGWTVAVARRASSSTASVTTRRAGFWSRPAWREFALLAAVYELYTLTRRLTAGDVGVAVTNARDVLRAEHLAGLAPERWLNHAVSIRPFLAVPADYAYATLHYVVTLVVLVWMWRAHPTAYLPARRTLMAATLLGLIGFATVPLAPPRMMPGFIDTMARYAQDGWWASAASAPKGLGSFTNQFAAMPSLHVGWAIWCGVLVARHAQRAWVRRLAVAYPVLVVLVVMSTANHYLLDAAAGLVALLTGYGIARSAVRLGWLKPPRPTLIGAQ